MALSAQYRAFIRDALSGLGCVEIRSMFGGAGVFLDGVMFAILADTGLYLKCDDTNRPDFEQAGTTPFTYSSKGKQVAMGYWLVPEYLFEDGDEMTTWAGKAHRVALAAKTGPKGR